MEERRKSRAEEIWAIHETIQLLNVDDTLELATSSSVQVHQSTVEHRAVARRAMDELSRSFRMPSNSASNLKLIFLVLSSRNADSSQVISMIYMVTLLKAEQGEDDGKKVCCIKRFGQTEDEGKVLPHHVSGHRDATADYKDQLSNTDACRAHCLRDHWRP